MAFGDGGGTIPAVVATRTALVRELIRVEASAPNRDTNDPFVIAVSGTLPRTFGNATLREVGLFDDSGTLIAYGDLNNEFIPAPTNEYGYSYTGTIRIRLDNTNQVQVIIADAPDLDHRQLTFRNAPEAHPASAITTLDKPVFDNDDNVEAVLTKLGTASRATVMTSLTDTTAGRLMPVGAFGLGRVASGADAAIVDCNSLTVGGVFYVRPTALNRPPESSGIVVSVSPYDSSFIKQVATWTIAGGESRTSERWMAAGVWQPWRLTYTQANIVGTVSQSAGVPTGAIIQRGGNANGQFTRFADGTQDCWVRRANSINSAESPMGASLFRTGHLYNWTYPISFSGLPVLEASPEYNGSVFNFWFGDFRGTSSVSTTYEYYGTSNTVFPDSVIENLTAKGRWFN
jgi:phage-related tail fiber protein